MRLVLTGDHAAVGGTAGLGLPRARQSLCVLPANDAGLRVVDDDGRLLLQDALDRHKFASRAGLAP